MLRDCKIISAKLKSMICAACAGRNGSINRSSHCQESDNQSEPCTIRSPADAVVRRELLSSYFRFTISNRRNRSSNQWFNRLSPASSPPLSPPTPPYLCGVSLNCAALATRSRDLLRPFSRLASALAHRSEAVGEPTAAEPAGEE